MSLGTIILIILIIALLGGFSGIGGGPFYGTGYYGGGGLGLVIVILLILLAARKALSGLQIAVTGWAKAQAVPTLSCAIEDGGHARLRSLSLRRCRSRLAHPANCHHPRKRGLCRSRTG